MKKKKENRKKPPTAETKEHDDGELLFYRETITPGAEDVGLDMMIVDGNLEKKSGNVKKKDCRFAHQGHPT